MLLSRGFPYEIGFVILVASILVLILVSINFFILRRIDFWARVSSNIARTLRSTGPLFSFSRKLKHGLSKLKRSINPKVFFITISLICSLLIGYWTYDLFLAQLGVSYDSQTQDSVWADQSEPIVIEFDRAFRTDLIVPQIRPEIAGRWEYQDKGISFLKRRVVFYPEETILPGEKVSVYLSHVNSLLPSPEREWDKELLFNSAPLPEITSFTPEKDSKPVGTTTDVVFQLSSIDGDFVSWEATIEPEVEFELVRNKSQVLRIQFPNPLEQNTAYNVKLNRVAQALNLQTGEVIIQEDPVQVAEVGFTTVKAPAIANAEPKGDKVMVNTNIKFTFDKPMDRETVITNLSLEPGVEFDTTWESDTVLVINPKQDLNKETKYTLKFAAGIKAADGGVFETDITHQFTTIGAVRVSAFSPVNNSARASTNTNIRVDFDQEVDKASAQAAFSINPSAAGVFSWQGNSMTFNPNANLSPSVRYTVKINRGVKSIHGVDSRDEFTSAFTTRPEVVNLAVPLTIQPYRFACNLTAAKMALQYKGVNLSVDSLYSQVAKDNTAYNESTNTWGNPNSGFVGDIRGNSRGYGVHWGPIANLIGKYRPVNTKSGWNLTDLLREVEVGNPVVVWAHNGYSGSGANTTWNLPGGGSVYTVKGMHSYVVKGFTGSPEAPSMIHLNDPNRGAWSVSPSYFNGIWGTFNRTAVVVK